MDNTFFYEGLSDNRYLFNEGLGFRFQQAHRKPAIEKMLQSFKGRAGLPAVKPQAQ